MSAGAVTFGAMGWIRPKVVSALAQCPLAGPAAAGCPLGEPMPAYSYTRPQLAGCVLTNSSAVADGWAGNDSPPNSCNTCRCAGGRLACTKMYCNNGGAGAAAAALVTTPAPAVTLSPMVAPPLPDPKKASAVSAADLRGPEATTALLVAAVALGQIMVRAK